MSWNNILPAWILFDICPTCGKKVKSRKEYPGVNCIECGGECPLKEEEADEPQRNKK